MQVIEAGNSPVVFAQIQKIDVEKRLIYARATDETPDRSGEAFDYVTSKPHFQKWSQEASDATNGASVGNLRAMHGKVAAGKFTEIQFNDEARAIDTVCKVTDNNEWDKVMDGTYTGLSIGGSYAKTWEDPVQKGFGGKALKRYTAIPSEISLVDRPCNPNAKFFEIRKADGSSESRLFKSQGETMKTRDEQSAELLAKSIDGITTETLAKLSDEELLAKHAEHCKEVAADPVEPAVPAVAKTDDVELTVNGSDDEVIEFAKTMQEKGLSMKQVIDFAKGYKAPDVTPLAKGLYTVGRLTEAVQSLSYIVESVKYEEQSEQDGSDIGARLLSAVGLLGTILIDMTTEEVGELTAAQGGNTAALAMADGLNGLVKASDEKLALIKAALEKIGARNSKADLGRIQAMHDHTAAMGATCSGATKTVETGTLQKLEATESSLAKAMTLLDEMGARLKKIEDTPAPARISLRAVAKGDDLTTAADPAKDGAITFKPILKGDGTMDESATAMKLALLYKGTGLHQ